MDNAEDQTRSAWLLQRPKVRAFVLGQKVELERRLSNGEILGQIQLDQKDEYLSHLTELSGSDFDRALEIFIEEKEAIWNDVNRKANLIISRREEDLKNLDGIGNFIGIVIGVAILLFLLFGVKFLMP